MGTVQAMTITRVADRYTLDREVGRGACGAVWAANDEVLRRPVAIKRVGPPPGSEDTETVRAEREAQLAAQVNHPNVISVFDLIQDDDDHYWLVMEYVEGCPLSTIIREQGPVPADELARLLAPVADALAVAHQLGIIHRDVKPSNILVRTDGEAKLSDFGIARAIQDATLTQTGAVTGSPAYIAPEVATGGCATPASDVWSFGATLFHALSGEPPYHSDDEDNTVLAVLFRIAHDDPPRLPSAGWLAPLIEMTMTRDPEARPTMAEVRDFLSERAPATPSENTPTTPDQTLVIPAVTTPTTGGTTDLATAAFTPEPPKPSTPPPPEPSSPQPPSPPDGPPPPIPSRAAGGRGSRATERRTVLIAAAAVAVLVLLGLALLMNTGGGNDPTLPTSDPTESAAQGQTGGQSPTDRPSEAAPTAEELKAFAENYVRTADRNPDAGFRMLTPAYQQRSPDYADFWGPMSNPRILEIRADPKAMTVSYTYQYDFPGVGNRTEQVTLELVQKGDQLLIDDAQ